MRSKRDLKDTASKHRFSTATKKSEKFEYEVRWGNLHLNESETRSGRE